MGGSVDVGEGGGGGVQGRGWKGGMVSCEARKGCIGWHENQRTRISHLQHRSQPLHCTREQRSLADLILTPDPDSSFLYSFHTPPHSRPRLPFQLRRFMMVRSGLKKSTSVVRLKPLLRNVVIACGSTLSHACLDECCPHPRSSASLTTIFMFSEKKCIVGSGVSDG